MIFESFTICLHPILSALYAAVSFLTVDPYWTPVNQQQKYFLVNHYSKKNDLAFFNDKELRVWVSRNHETLNEILRKERFSIQLQPFSPRGFGVVSILDVMVEWLDAGEKTKIHRQIEHNDLKDYAKFQEYPAVKIEKGFTVYKSDAHKHPVICLQTKSGDLVWITIADQPLQSFELHQRMTTILQSRTEQKGYDFIKFPMVDLDQKIDIAWLLNMRVGTFETWSIDQALQQTKFKMNEKGAHARSAVAIGVKRLSAASKSVAIDRPFYVCITRPSVELPILTAYITEKNWKDPLDLAL